MKHRARSTRLSRLLVALALGVCALILAPSVSAQSLAEPTQEPADSTSEEGASPGVSIPEHTLPGRVGGVRPSSGIDRHALNGTPFTLGAHNWYLGVTRLGRGVTNRIDVYTTHLLWGLLSPNGSVRWRFHERERFSAALNLGVGYLNLNFISRIIGLDYEGSTAIYTIPAQLSAAWTFRNGDSLAFDIARLTINGDASFDDIGGGAVATSLTSWGFNWINRTRRRLQMEMRAQVGSSADVKAAGETETYEIDDDTTVTVYADSSVDLSDQLGFNLSYNVIWRYQGFHFGLGLAYGNTLGFGIPIKVSEPRWTPTMELYWTF